MAVDPEALLISAVLTTGDVLEALGQGITVDKLSSRRHAWDFILKRYNRTGEVPSKAEVKHRFPDLPFYKATDVASIAASVVDSWTREQTLALLSDATSHVEADDVNSALRTLMSGTREITSSRGTAKQIDLFGADFANQMMNEVQLRMLQHDNGGSVGVPTGLPFLDLATGGLGKGWICTVATRFSVGKTWITLRMAEEAIFTGHNVLYVSLEMLALEIAMRLHPMIAPRYNELLDNTALTQGRGVDLPAYQRLLDKAGPDLSNRFTVMDQSGGRITIDDISAALRRGTRSGEPYDICFIDYLSLLIGNGDTDDWKRFGDTMAEIKVTGGELGIPMVPAAQIGRAGDGKLPPGGKDLAESDRIGQHTDILVTGSKPAPNVLHMLLEKNRHGPQKILSYFHFEPWRGTFIEIPSDRAADLMSPADVD